MLANVFSVLWVLIVLRSGKANVAPSIPATTDCTINASDGFGYELILTRLEDFESKFWKFWLQMIEQNEQLVLKHSLIEATHQKIMRKLDSLEQTVGHNLTEVMDRSWEILQQQLSCSNHENWQQSILAMLPKNARNSSLNCSKQSTEKLTFAQEAFKSCSEVPANVSGKYMLHPVGFDDPFEAYCEQQASEGGWLVVQYRFDGSVDFFRNWTEYREGFGNLDGEFWIGLEKLHRLTKGGNYSLMVELKDYDDVYRYARYDNFEIGSEDEKYRLISVGGYMGTAGNSLSYHVGMKFSTLDSDNDITSGQCALDYKGAWWYNSCFYSNLNGLYRKGNDAQNLCWYHIHNNYEGQKYSRMMIRKK